MPSPVSIAPLPVLVRAKSSPPLNVLKIAQGSDAEPNVTARPACWNWSPEKLAENSSECGAVKTADGVLVVVSGRQAPVGSITHAATRAPSTRSTPSSMMEYPSGLHGTSTQPAGSDGPVNSAPEVGARITSPSAVCATYVLADVPAAKSVEAVSRSVGPGTVKVGAATVVVLPERSAAVSR